jgi:hypothetical protein
MKITRLLMAWGIAFTAVPVHAVDFGRSAVGTAGSEFLLLDTSARGISMGGAMSAVSDDSNSVYWNPAGLTKIPRASASFMHSQYAADITYQAISYGQRVNDSSVLGLGLRYLDGGSIAQTDVNGQSNGSFHPRSYVGEVGWGQSIYDLSDSEIDVTMGVTARAIRSDLGVKAATGFGGDIGLQSRMMSTAHEYDIGVVLQNVGSGQKFSQVRDTSPTRIRIGSAIKLIKTLTLSVEGIAAINNSPYGAAGAEWTIDVDRHIQGAARFGFNTLTMESLGVSSCLNLGLGIKFNDISFDYAFVPMGVLGSATHRISLNYNLPAKISHKYRER